MRTAVAVAVLTFLLAPAASAQTVPDLRPPDAYLSSPSSGEMKAEIQAFSWSEPDGSGGIIGVCGDRFDAIDPAPGRRGDRRRPRCHRRSRRSRSRPTTPPAPGPTSRPAPTLSGSSPRGSRVTPSICSRPSSPRPPGPGLLPPEILDAIARIRDAAGGFALVDGRLEEGLSEVLAATEALIAALHELVNQVVAARTPG